MLDNRAAHVQRVLSVCRNRPGHIRAYAQRHEHCATRSTQLQVSKRIYEFIKKKTKNRITRQSRAKTNQK